MIFVARAYMRLAIGFDDIFILQGTVAKINFVMDVTG